MTLLTELRDKTASLVRPLTTAMTSMLLLGLLASSGSGGTNDGVLNFSTTPLLLRQPTITTFDAPGSGTGPGQGTITFAINPAGTISGRYADAAGAIHAILRSPDGTIISFDAPGAGTGPRQGTRPFSINPAGTSAGYFNDASGVFHGSAHSGRCDHYLERPGCGHKSRPGYLRRQYQSGGGDRGTLR